MNTYEKHGGRGVLLLTRFPRRESVLRSIATKDLSSHSTKNVYPESAGGGGVEGSLFVAGEFHPERVRRSERPRDLSMYPTGKLVLPAPRFSARSFATIHDGSPAGKELS